MKKFLRWLDINFEPLCMTVMFYLMSGLMVLQVILRFAFHTGCAWGEEVSRFIFVWLVFLSIPYAVRNARHISIDFIREFLPVPIKKAVMIIVDAVALIMFALFLKDSVLVVKHALYYGDTAQTLNANLSVVYSAAVIGYALMEIRMLQALIWKLRHLHSSYDLFQNTNGRYSGATKLFFMPAHTREEEEALMDSEVVKECERFIDRKKGAVK